MQYLNWRPNTAVESPVYLDANVLVGTKVSNHPLYKSCVQISAEILITKANVLVSELSIDECIWAMAKLAYCQMTNQPSNAHWNKKIYQKWCERIFQSYATWITAAGEMVKDWKNAGVNINFVPSENLERENIMDLAPTYMRDYKLTPADAFHLAIAEKRAKSFITADSDFSVLQANPPVGNLTILYIAKS